MKTWKQISISFLVVALLVTGIVTIPIKAHATEASTETVVKESMDGDETGIIYVLDETNYKFSNHWTEGAKKAPIREGFVFGGWYTNTEDDGTGTFNAIREDAGTSVKKAWAKFVPAEVMSIRVQLEAETETSNGTNVTENETTYLRLLSGVNSLNYQKVGFDIKYNKNIADPDAEVSNNLTKVFKKITNAETGENGIEANAVFGKAATHFSALRIEGIYAVNFPKVIYVTPHWTTLDGTYVEGQAKYVRVMDCYVENQYISVPVNFMSGSSVAAGQITLSYDQSKLELVQVDGMETAGFESGTLMSDMSYKDNQSTGKLKIVGNISEAPQGNAAGVNPESDIFANVWFKVKDNVDVTAVTAWQFKIQDSIFCDWNEQYVNNLIAWDVKHLK